MGEDNNQMRATILALETTTPETALSQEHFSAAIARFLDFSPSHEKLLKRITTGSQIQKRHTAVPDFYENGLQSLSSEKSGGAPTTSDRNLRYKEVAPKLAESVCDKALKNWGGDRAAITHVISVSCTGMVAPGIEFLLVKRLGLSPNVDRLAINFMGCYGAFKGLSTAKALALENPKNRVLMVCTELCSLHFQADLKTDTLVSNSLFADGAAAVVVGARPEKRETPLLELHRQRSAALCDTLEEMSWEAGDYGYQMRLSASVPSHLESHAFPFVRHLIGPDLGFDACAWAIHPGGKSILDSITKACGLEKKQLSASWKVLNDYGNMSSPTFLFVLKEILSALSSKEWVVGLGFGPGLAFEGLLLKRVDKNVAR